MNDVLDTTDLYVEAVNAADPDRVLALYTSDAVSAWDPDRPLTGQAHHDSVREFLAQRPRMKAKVRESYITSDTALLVVDWSIDIEHESGEVERLKGVGTDVLRLGHDGRWRYAVDSPFGEDV